MPLISMAEWSATGLPDGMSIDPDMGHLIGRATTAGSYNPEITVTTNWGTDTASVALEVED